MSTAANLPATLADERLACAVLAAQVLALRDTFRTAALPDSLWQASEALALLAAQAGDTSAAAALAALGQGLEAQAFMQAQSCDRASQMADTVAAALWKLAASNRPAGTGLAADDLLALYVSEEQRRVHDAVVGRRQEIRLEPA